MNANVIGRPSSDKVFLACGDGRGVRGRLSARGQAAASHLSKITLICATAGFLADGLSAAPIGEEKARQTASAYVGDNYAPSSLAKATRRLASPSPLVAGVCRRLGGGTNAVGYAVELLPSGFVVVRADDELTPVKLHSATGSYESLPSGFRQVIEEELAGELFELAEKRSITCAPETRVQAVWQQTSAAGPLDETYLLTASLSAEEKSAGTPLLITTWDQISPYNSCTPTASGGSGGHASAGCGPVAMGQIIRYFKQPAAPRTDFTNTDSYGSCRGVYRISDVGGLGNYDWANMPAELTSSSSAAEDLAVGRLLYHCGVALKANFEGGSSSVISQLYAARAFREVFGYTCEEYRYRSEFATEAWFAKIQGDIDAKRPVYYTMQSASAGHALVCDGYRNGNEIHLNFGFSGYGDAWYNIDSVVFMGYTWSQHAAVFGIAPDPTPATNALTVVGGGGGGDYLGGSPVTVSADAPPEGYGFKQWNVKPEDTDLGGDFVQTQAVASVVMPNHQATLTAQYKAVGLPPKFTQRSPAAAEAAINEGAEATFSVTASDAADPVAAARGMVSVTWAVDGVQALVTKRITTGSISSSLTYRPGSNTVKGAPTRDIVVTAVALDKQGDTTATNWTVCVSNVPAQQTISFPALPVKAFGDADFDPGARASSGLAAAYASSNESVAQIIGGQIHIVGTGTAVITASQAGDIDSAPAAAVSQTLTVKARLAAEIPGGGGSVTGAGLYAPGTRVALTAKPASGYTFLCWENGSQTTARSVAVPATNATVVARFGLTASLGAPLIADPGAVQAMVGVTFSLPLTVASESLPTVSASGLPGGLKYDAAAGSIVGVPTAAVSNRAVTIVAKNANRTTQQAFMLTVSPLSAWAQGTFNGWFESEALGSGAATLTVTALGKISGKLTSSGKTYSFSAASYTNAFAFSAAVATGGLARAQAPLTVTVTHPDVFSGGPAALGVAAGALGDGCALTAMYRNVWKDADMRAAVTNRSGYYTASLPGGEDYGSGYLTLTVDRAGGVKTAGKLADGTAVSLSGPLVLDEAGRVYAVLYTAPIGYKGGSFCGMAEFAGATNGERAVVRPLDGAPLLWQSRNPQATGRYADMGFARSLGLTGGWYDTLGNLYAYYAGQSLAAGTDAGADVPGLTVGTNRYASAWWNPGGLTVAAVTNAAGVMTGLSAPKAAAPPKVNGAYDYDDVTNAVGLTISLKRATGVFGGSFSAWFDYATAHTAKKITFEGVLTPVREDTSDGVAGRGYFLWSDKSTYANAAGKTVGYSFNWSYDFLLHSTPAGE